MSVTKSTFFLDTIPSIELTEQSLQEQEYINKTYSDECKLDNDISSFQCCNKCGQLLNECGCEKPIKLPF